MKKVRKILPLSIYDIPEIEKWLEEQANAGLFPVYVNSWVTFTENGVPGTRFCLVAKEEKEISLDQLELFRDAGWHYAGSVAGIYFLFYTTDPEAVEVYSDWESRGLSLKPLKKRMISCRIKTWILYAVMAAVIIWALFFFVGTYDIQPDHGPHLTMALLILLQPVSLLAVLAAVWLWRQNRRDWRLLRRTYRAMEQGMEPPPSQGPSKVIVRDQIILMALLLSLAVLLLIGSLNFLNPWKEIPLERFPQPYISLQSVEQEEVFPWEDLFEEGPVGGKPENYAEKKFSVLAPVWYEVTQQAYSPQSGSEPNYFSPKPENGLKRYAPDLDAAYFDLLIPAMSRPVAEAQMDAYRLVNLEWSYTDLSCPGLDFAIYATEPDGIWQMLAIGKGHRVAVFRYAGREQLPERLQVLSQAVE